MTATLSISVDGLARIEAGLARTLTPNALSIILKPPVTMTLVVGQNHLAQSPGKPHYPIAWTSERQRRFVMAKLRREGGPPYVRKTSAGVVGGWTHKVTDIPGGVRGVLGNNTPYAIFVQGERQQRFHADTGWHTTKEAMELMSAVAQKNVDTAIAQALRAAGLA